MANYLQTSLHFRDEAQRKSFDVAIAQTGLKQKKVIQAMIDEFLENQAHNKKIVARAAK